MALKDQIRENPLLALLILVAIGVVGFMMVGLFTGKAVGVSGVLLTILVFFGLGVLLYILRGAGEKAIGAEDFILLIMASAGVFGLIFLITRFSPGSFSIFDQSLSDFQMNLGGMGTIWSVFIVSGLIWLLFTESGKRATKKLGF